MTADLDLLVTAADEFVSAARHPASQVAGAVHAFTGSAEGVGNKSFRCRSFPPEISPGQLRTSQIELSALSVGNRLQRAVEEIRAGSRERVANSGFGAVRRQ